MKPQYFVAILFGFSLYWMYFLYQPFLSSMTIAGLLAISTSNIQNFLEKKINSKLLATLISSLLLAILFFGPFVYILTTLTMMLKSVNMSYIMEFESFIKQNLTNPPEMFRAFQPYTRELIANIDLKDGISKIVSWTGHIGAFSAGFLKNAFLMIVFYFIAQYHSGVIVNFIKRISQMNEYDSSILSKELSSVMNVVLYSIVVTAAFEGFLFGIAVSFLGYNGLFFGILFGFASLVPIVGAALMWIPFMVYEFFLGDVYSAIFIALYTVIVISIIADTFIKPLIIQKINKLLLAQNETQLDSLVIFFAMIAGLSTFGFWGMILGPAITAFFLAILKVFEARTKECEKNLEEIKK